MKIYLKIMLALALLITQMACEKKAATSNLPEQNISDSLIASLKTTPVRLRKIVNEIKLNGYVTTNENLEAHVYALVSGKTNRVFVENGDYVKKGQSLATIQSIETVDISSQVMQSQNQVEITRKNLQFQKELFEENMATKQEVAQAEMEHTIALADLTRNRQLAGITGGEKGIYTLKAPIDGYIIQKNITPASEVRSDHNDILFTVADLSRVWIIANVFESDIQKIHLNNPVQIKTLSGEDKIYSGKIDKIYHVLDEQTKTMKVRIALTNADNALKPGMFASVLVREEQEEFMPTVPSESIVMDNSKHYIILKKGDALSTREITIRKRINGISYIGNAKEGEEVVIENCLFLFDALMAK